MIAKCPLRTFSVKFGRSKRQVEGKELIDTYCSIDELNNGKYFEIASAKAELYIKDKYSKSVGKKIALTRAIKSTDNLLKEEREIIWEEFKNIWDITAKP